MRGSTSWADGESCPGGACCPKSGTLALHRHGAWGQWAVELLQCSASLLGGIGQWNSCYALPHCLGEVGSGTRATHCPIGQGQWQCNSRGTLPHCVGAVHSATPAMQRHTAWGRWAVELMQCTASLLGGIVQWNSCHALPQCLGAVGSGTPTMRGPSSWGDGESCPRDGRCLKSGIPAVHYLTARGQWAVELMKHTASLHSGSGQCNACNALPHRLGAEVSGTLTTHCFTASGSGQWYSCNALPHCLAAVGRATAVMHSIPACGHGQ